MFAAAQKKKKLPICENNKVARWDCLLLWRLGGSFCLLDIITALKLHLWEWNEKE